MKKIKKKKHEHSLFIEEIFQLIGYTFVVAILRCSDGECEFETWDYGNSMERD